MMSALSSRAVCRIFCAGTITPRLITSKLLHWSTTPTMFLPMSCTSPFTVAMTILPLASRIAGPRLLRLDERHEVRDRLLHHARRLHHLRQEHLAGAEEVADDVHAVHQRPLDHLDRPLGLLARLLGVLDDPGGDPLHERVRKALLDRALAPGEVLLDALAARLDGLGELHQPLGRVAAAVEDHVLDVLEEILRDLRIDAELPGVDDAHRHAGPDRVIQERGVHRLAHRVVAAERERQVGHAAGDLDVRQVLPDPARRLDEIEAVGRVLLEPGRDGEDVRVEDDVLGRHADRVHEGVVAAPEDLDAALERVGLAFLVEGHHHHRCAVAAREARLPDELRLAFLERDRVHHRLALHALETGLDHRPLRAVDHHRHARDVGLGGDEVEERPHGGLRVEHRLVHVDVDHLRAVLDLLARDRERLPGSCRRG